MKISVFNFVLVLFITQHSLATGLTCHNLFKGSIDSKKSLAQEFQNKWNSDFWFIKAAQEIDTMGNVQTFYSEKWQTQVYFTQTSFIQNSKSQLSIDPESKGIYLFFHGSGTMKSSGRNYKANMNNLANLGFSAVAIDLPFHSQGPRSSEFNDVFYFMEWIKNIVLELKQHGKPVYLAGHSFGPDVVFEFITRYPKLVDGAIALSPASFNKELEKWYDNYTSKMNFGGNIDSNEAGGIWAGQISRRFVWRKGVLPDPTKINPNLKLRILSGDREEYVPGPLGADGLPSGANTYDITIPLKERFSQATINVEKGIGHYLFEHQDENGINVVMRELLSVTDINPSNYKKEIEKNKHLGNSDFPSIKVLKWYAQNPQFKLWADMQYGETKIQNMGFGLPDALALKVLKEYQIAKESREREIFDKILATREQEPEFYEKYKTIIEKFDPKKVDTTLFIPFSDYMSKKSVTTK